MKYRLLDLLVCPSCYISDLQLTVITEDRSASLPEIIDGLLDCPLCLSAYPIVGGIPRMMPDSIEEHGPRLTNLLSGMLSSNEGRLMASPRQPVIGHWLAAGRGSRSRADARDIRLVFDTIGSCDLTGALSLNLYCGSGRYLKAAVDCGSEVVGIDCSRTIEKTYSKMRSLPNVHVVQGNLAQLPFTPCIFDYIFCIDALRRMPDIRPWLRLMCTLLQPGGRIGICTNPDQGLVRRACQWLFPAYVRDRHAVDVAEWFRDEGWIEVETSNRPLAVSAGKGAAHGGAIDYLSSAPYGARAAGQS
jgi:uncharacterized protein YbaR (Trm112 family)